RMEPQYMILGHAAGVAAALAVQAGVAVQRVDIVTLQRRLAEQGQALTARDAVPTGLDAGAGTQATVQRGDARSH
ncbi:MAG: FAD-dependent oxidoreductase, partial [Thermomicrobiales bacterium]